MTEDSLLFAGILCHNTKWYFLDIAFATNTAANLINVVQVHHLYVITLYTTT